MKSTIQGTELLGETRPNWHWEGSDASIQAWSYEGIRIMVATGFLSIKALAKAEEIRTAMNIFHGDLDHNKDVTDLSNADVPPSTEAIAKVLHFLRSRNESNTTFAVVVGPVMLSLFTAINFANRSYCVSST